MGFSPKVVFFLFLALLVYNINTLASERCPPRSQVTKSTVCRADHDCKYGKVCCPNAYNTKSCADPTPYTYGAGYDKNKAGGPGVYCGGVKCSPYEVCKEDPVTKRLKCQRA